MSLDFRLDTIEGYKDLCWTGEGDERHMNPITEVLIFTCIPVGIGEITDETVEEFVARAAIYQAVKGSLLQERDKDGSWRGRVLSEADIRAHKGLKTNVFPAKPRAEFIDNLMRNNFPKAVDPAGLHTWEVLAEWGQDGEKGTDEFDVQAETLIEARAKARARLERDYYFDAEPRLTLSKVGA